MAQNAETDSATLRDLTTLLSPRAIAVIGATSDTRRVGGRPIAYLNRYNFPGPIYPVNPKYPEIAGLCCYARVADLPEVPDLAIIAVPAAGVAAALRECQALGIPAVNIYTSGFGEIGDEGKVLEDEIRALAEAEGTIVAGPNSQGVANLLDDMCANFSSTLGLKQVAKGSIGFVCQSGLFAGILAAECHARGLGVGYLISTGNEAGADFSDFLGHIARDPRIRVVVGYLEGVRDGARLRAAAEVAREQGKPVIILKVGRVAAGAAAAASHTGALAGEYAAYQAAFRQWGIIEADTIEELYDLAELFSLAPEPALGDRVGIVSNSGGIGVYAADKTTELGLTMAAFSEETTAALKERLPAFGSARNPVDFTLQAFHDAEGVGAHIRHILSDPGVDIACVFFGVQLLNVSALVEEIKAANALNAKPLLVGWMHGDPAGPAALRAAGIPVFDDPLKVMRAARALVSWGRVGMPASASAVPPESVSAAVARLGKAAQSGRLTLSEHEANAVLEAAGVPVARHALAEDAVAAGRRADEIGYPVAMKIESPDILHKTEAGGVVLGLTDGAAVRRSFDRIVARARAYAPEAEIAGVSIHEMIEGAVELIVGVKRDPAFGPLIMVGLGGVLVEILRDTVIRVAPVSVDEAEAMLRELKGFALLDGARGRPKCDISAIADCVSRISILARAAPMLAELDINPLMALPAGQGVKAADALVTLRPVE